MYEIKEMSPEPVMLRSPMHMPKKTSLPMRPYFNEPMCTSDYIYQQTLKPKQKPPIWRLIPIDGIPTRKPNRIPKELPPIPCDPRLDPQTIQDLEEMIRLQEYPEDWIKLDQI